MENGNNRCSQNNHLNDFNKEFSKDGLPLEKNCQSSYPQNNKKAAVITAVCVVLFLIFFGVYQNTQNTKQQLKEFRKTRFYMDTFVELIVLSSDEKQAEAAMENAFSQFALMDEKFNFYNDDSLLGQINKEAQIQIDDPHMLKLLELSLDFAKKSGGAFDPAMGAVKRLYPFGEENPSPPDPVRINEALMVSGYGRVTLQGGHLQKPEELLLDLGGAAKGYAADRAAEALREGGIRHALINAGGDIITIGKNLSGENWRIGVDHPRASRSEIAAIITLDNEAVATSGDYQRYFFKDGERFHHILDPATGRPAMTVFSVTVTAPDALTADILSTAVFVMGREEGIKFLEENRFKGIVIDETGLHTTADLKDSIKINM